ncbi:MAG: DUF2953 domain-containing protein [Lachnospiraceae bacterium]|nr:DUF2953 domain-containing protein [Lachnospiraceae bacterium]
MISILLTILKILGIILLVLLGIVLTVLILVLFVPVRYRLDAHRDLQEEAPVVASVKATWLLHLLSVFFSYPDAAYVHVKALGITVYRSDQERKPKKPKESGTAQEETDNQATEAPEQQTEQSEADWDAVETESATESGPEEVEPQEEAEESEETEEPEEEPTIKKFFQKLWEKLKNIEYTIRQICDKIKHIVKNIRYYLKVIQSTTFKNAFSLCSGQLFSLLKSIRPRKVKGSITIGTGDPASTGQVLGIYGMLYPLLGNNISITPDFDRQIVEGELLVKGRITVFKALKMALVIFFNKDVRRLIKLLKREAK